MKTNQIPPGLLNADIAGDCDERGFRGMAELKA